MYFRPKTSAGRAYLQIAESRREGDQVRQQVIATLGRFEDLQASGQLERLVRSGARFTANAMMLSAAANDAAIDCGPPDRTGAGIRAVVGGDWWRRGDRRRRRSCRA
jgi:hypothetical protein